MSRADSIAPHPPTSRAELDRALAALQKAKGRFAVLSVDGRLELIAAILERSRKVAADSVAAALKAKRIDPQSPAAGEEWLGGPMVVHRNLRLLTDSLQQIKMYGRTKIASSRLTTRPDGQVVADVFPTSLWDKLLFKGFSAQIWMEPGLKAEDVRDAMAAAYRDGLKGPGKVCLVLGAGNVASIGPMDVLHKMFVENQVCILKMNPVNEYLGPFIEDAFQPAVEAGYLRVVYGGAEVGSYLVGHASVEEIHITGSDKTHDAIVWGPPGPDREQRKAENRPLIDKPITSELGNVSPIIVVPGPWSASDLEFQAENIASMMANNASFNCNAAKLLIQSASWDQRDNLLAILERKLAQVPQRHAYYPGAQQRYESFLKVHPEAREVGRRTEETLPWTLIPHVDPRPANEICFNTEAFCSLLAETGLPAEDPAEFLDRAVRFCNDRVWGTLNVTLLIHPQSEKDPAVRKALDSALSRLRYGTIAVNHWAALGYGMVVTPWGAHPGHTLQDIQSGRGFVHNTLMFDRPQKCVVRGPFRIVPKPPWFATSKQTHRIAPLLSDFEADPKVRKLPGILVKALGN